MDDDNKRVDISDLPKPEEELTEEAAKSVEGGLTKEGQGTLPLANSANVVGGSLADGRYLKKGDGSV